MAYRDILVFLDGSHDNEARLDFALSLAKAHSARLTGVDVNTAAAFEGEWSQRAQTVGEVFQAKADQAGVSIRSRAADRKSTGWKDLYAHYSDLLHCDATQHRSFRDDPPCSSRGCADVGRGSHDCAAAWMELRANGAECHYCMVSEQPSHPCGARCNANP